MRSIGRSVNGVGYRSLALNSEAGLMPSRFGRGDGAPRYNGNGSSPMGHYRVHAVVVIRNEAVA